MEKHMTIRPLRDSETALLEEFLYEAVYRPDPSRLLSREILRRPSLRIYIEGFGTLDFIDSTNMANIAFSKTGVYELKLNTLTGRITVTRTGDAPATEA